jgi:hypothetical protein
VVEGSCIHKPQGASPQSNASLSAIVQAPGSPAVPSPVTRGCGRLEERTQYPDGVVLTRAMARKYFGRDADSPGLFL